LKIYVVGARGQLGQSLVKLGCEPIYNVITDDFNQIKLAQTDVVINAAAKTNGQFCQLNPDEAFESNARLAQLLAKACKKANASLFHVSTDYVFDGRRGQYSDWEGINPGQDIYALSKAAGELYVNAYAIPGTCIVRTAWVFSPFKKAWFDSETIWDQTGSITYGPDLAKFLMRLTRVPKYERPSILHYATLSPVKRSNIAALMGNKSYKLVAVPEGKPRDSSLIISEFCYKIYQPMPIGACVHEYRKAYPLPE
jgi:dTDP-4-dehydrorhamnose reductase